MTTTSSPIACKSDPDNWKSCKSPVIWARIDERWNGNCEYYCDECSTKYSDRETGCQDIKWLTIEQKIEKDKKEELERAALEAEYKVESDNELFVRHSLYSQIRLSGWIECKKALPELDREVLISDYRSVSTGFRNSKDLGAFYHISRRGSSLCFIQPSIWMPLNVFIPEEKQNVRI